MVDSLVTKIFKVPNEVVDSGFIRIVGDQRHCLFKSFPMKKSRWALLAMEWIPEQEKTKGEYFEITEEELKEWRKAK